MKNSFIKILFVVLVLFSCNQNVNLAQSLKIKYEFPSRLHEVSGITYVNGLLWTLEDSGNEPKITALNDNGTAKQEIVFDSISNIDWEELTKDENQHLYIGDFGNNDNDRKDLSIYKVSAPDYNQVTEKITFHYPEQIDFPAKKKKKFYDCEAFFYHKNYFYLFTKNRSKEFDGTTLIYKIPAKAGNHAAKLIGTYTTCGNYNSCVITGAAISPDAKKVVLLSHDRLWLFENFKNDAFTTGTATMLKFDHYSQKESICFKDNATLLIADERSKKMGGNLYEVTLEDLKNTN